MVPFPIARPVLETLFGDIARRTQGARALSDSDGVQNEDESLKRRLERYSSFAHKGFGGSSN